MVHAVPELFLCWGISLCSTCLRVFLGFLLHVCSQDSQTVSPYQILSLLIFEEINSFHFLWKQRHNLSPQCNTLYFSLLYDLFFLYYFISLNTLLFSNYLYIFMTICTYFIFFLQYLSTFYSILYLFLSLNLTFFSEHLQHFSDLVIQTLIS